MSGSQFWSCRWVRRVRFPKLNTCDRNFCNIETKWRISDTKIHGFLVTVGITQHDIPMDIITEWVPNAGIVFSIESLDIDVVNYPFCNLSSRVLFVRIVEKYLKICYQLIDKKLKIQLLKNVLFVILLVLFTSRSKNKQ